MTTAITQTRRIGPRLVEVGVLARESGLHPELVTRFVRLGLLEPEAGSLDAPLFAPDAAAQLARAARLRRDLGVGYGGAVLACELLARIDRLEARLRRYETPNHRPR
jgi:chaperone modulatory protein CbpM